LISVAIVDLFDGGTSTQDCQKDLAHAEFQGGLFLYYRFRAKGP
jgi:hypothetical protein